MNYYKARMYSPTLGRFMQTDPIGYKDGINWYDYVDGDPVDRSDPSGLESGQVSFDSTKSLTEGMKENPPSRTMVVVSVGVVGAAVGCAAGASCPAAVAAAARFMKNQLSGQSGQTTAKGGTQAAERPNGVPKGFEPSPTSKGGGTKYTDPANPHNNVRDMPGNPNSPNPAQQSPYVKENVSGQPIDGAGRPVSGNSPESHIPRDQYQYRGKVKPDG
jgi:hypothetical protein